MSRESTGSQSAAMADVWRSAAALQRLVPDAVLVGGSAAALFAHHRLSTDHDHVVADLRQRFDIVLEALESQGDWITNRVVPGKIILGDLGGIETGVRQLIRRRPLETVEMVIDGHPLVVPTLAEILRIKGFLMVKRNQVRDYLDVVALSDTAGLEEAADVLAHIDDYYADQVAPGQVDGVASQIAKQLANPQPADRTTIGELEHYKGLIPKWRDWSSVVRGCKALAAAMVLDTGP